jgi:8-oxo-dGTP diphosphatase
MQVSEMLLVVAAALFDGEGRVLLQQRPPGKPMAGLWEFPGGKIEPGETPEAALVRELHEELGIRLREEDLKPATFASAPLAGRHLLLLLYVSKAWEGAPVAHHATALRWARPEEMRALPMPPADVPLVEWLVNGRPGGLTPR